MELNNYIGEIITGVITALIGFFVGRRKENMDLQTSELDNIEKGIEIYRKMIEDLSQKIESLSEKYAVAISDLENANRRIRELETSIDDLVKELKKYKQLNGKN